MIGGRTVARSRAHRYQKKKQALTAEELEAYEER